MKADPKGVLTGSHYIDGDHACTEGALAAGCRFIAGYPITPSTGVMDAFKEFCERFRVDPETGKKRYCILQAEDELAAAGMVLGANWMGARAFTPTSGPGISLMSEFIGLAYYAEVPSVFVTCSAPAPPRGCPRVPSSAT